MYTEFKVKKSDWEKICINGGLAPSGGNLQPWRVKIKHSQIMEIRIDNSTSYGLLDVGRFASLFALGAFLENVIITSTSLGYLIRVNKLKQITDFDSPLIKIYFVGNNTTPSEHDLYHEIGKRITNRKIYNGVVVGDDLIVKLRNVLRNFDPRFVLYSVKTEKEKEKVAEVLGKADAIRILNDSFFKDMMNEIRWSKKDEKSSKTGIYVKALELTELVEKMFKLLQNHPSIRSIIPRKALEEQAKPILQLSSHLCCFCMKKQPDPISMLNAGQAIERLWLTATKSRLSLHPWTILPFLIIRNKKFDGKGLNKQERLLVNELELKIYSLFNIPSDAFPIFIFRLSYTDEPFMKSIRMNWKKFTEFQNKDSGLP